MSAPFNFHLEHYDGPLDLLLDLIRKQEIDIYNIPIAQITAQYLEYMQRAAEMDVAAAHEYLKQSEFSITIELHQGVGSCVFWTTDLTAEYVRINADYST